MLVLLNLARIFVIDPTYETKLCPLGEGEGGDEEGDERRRLFGNVFLPHLARKLHRRMLRSLREEEEDDEEEEEEFHPVCYTFLFEYAFVVVMQLGLIMVVVYLFSAYYHQAMLKTLLEEEETILG